jgi:hypothetical protein
VRSRPVRNPIFLGLGTAAILAAGGATTAALAAPTPSPSGTEGSAPSATDTPTPTPTPTPTGSQDPQTEPPPKLHVNVVATTTTTVAATKSVKASIHVYAAPSAPSTILKLATTKTTTISPTCTRISGGCNLQTVDDDGVFVPVTITIPKGTSTGSITFTATASATDATSVKDTLGITVRKAATSSPPSASGSGGGGDSGDSGGSGGSGGSGSSSNGTSGGSGSNGTTTSIPGSGSAFIPPSAAGQLAPATNGVPSAQFPQIAPQNGQPGVGSSPVVAGGRAQNMGALRAASPEPQELTFQRLASTQAAWLAALLVAFSLLLTHIRLNKPADARRRKGIHRRQRSGVFQA